MFPPLFPLLIAAFSSFTHDYECASRWVGILLGSALPLPMYGIALRLFNRRAALVAALIAACHPLFINLSISVLSEGPYITLLLSAIYLVLRALDQATIKNWCFVGAAFGLAFAIRQESVAPMFIAAFLALVAIAGTRVSRFKCSVAAVVTFLVFISPDIFVLYKNTGHLRLEGKSAVNFAIGSRMLAGQDQNQAGYAINQKLEGTGVWMCSNATVIRETRTSIKTLMRVGVKGMSLNVPNLFYQVFGTMAWISLVAGSGIAGSLSPALAQSNDPASSVRLASARDCDPCHLHCRAWCLPAKLFCVSSIFVDLGCERRRCCCELDKVHRECSGTWDVSACRFMEFVCRFSRHSSGRSCSYGNPR